MNSRVFNVAPPQQRLIGHRGVAARAPENTMASFMLAANQGIDWIEFDVQLTKDHFFVIFHDDTLQRTTDGNGLVYQHTLRELHGLDAGSWFSPSFQGEKIPELVSCLKSLFTLGLNLNIELKVPENPPKGYLHTFALTFSQTINLIWPKNKALPLLSSFNWALLNEVRSYLPTYPIGYLSDTCSMKMIDEIAALSNASLHCEWISLKPDFLEYAHLKSVPLLVYTVNDPKLGAFLLQQHVFALFSDDPLRLAKEIPSAF